MNPFMSRELANEHIRDLHEEVARAGRTHGREPAETKDAGVTVRRFSEPDIDGIRLLAALDGKQIPLGGILVAEQAGEVVAALPLDGGEALADPFRPTADIVALLRLRARQLREANRPASSGFRLSPRMHLPRRRLA
jgi:hypothetical protein